jgi:ribosomal protein S18 acetylase RimI-like enzyme
MGSYSQPVRNPLATSNSRGRRALRVEAFTLPVITRRQPSSPTDARFLSVVSAHTVALPTLHDHGVDVLIREATPSQFDEIARFTVSAYRALRDGRSLGGYEVDLLDVAHRAAHATVLVAIDEHGSVVGSVTFVERPGTPMSEFTDEDACGIRMLAVDPAHQGKGAGRELTEACIDRARELGRGRVLLHSTAEMTIAHGMYERRGFHRDPGRDVVVDTEHGPLLLMSFELPLS